MKTVRATRMGYFNGSRVRPGAVFQVADEAEASWWEVVTPPASKPPAQQQPLRSRARPAEPGNE